MTNQTSIFSYDKIIEHSLINKKLYYPQIKEIIENKDQTLKGMEISTSFIVTVLAFHLEMKNEIIKNENISFSDLDALKFVIDYLNKTVFQILIPQVQLFYLCELYKSESSSFFNYFEEFLDTNSVFIRLEDKEIFIRQFVIGTGINLTTDVSASLYEIFLLNSYRDHFSNIISDEINSLILEKNDVQEFCVFIRDNMDKYPNVFFLISKIVVNENYYDIKNDIVDALPKSKDPKVLIESYIKLPNLLDIDFMNIKSTVENKLDHGLLVDYLPYFYLFLYSKITSDNHLTIVRERLFELTKKSEFGNSVFEALLNYCDDKDLQYELLCSLELKVSNFNVQMRVVLESFTVDRKIEILKNLFESINLGVTNNHNFIQFLLSLSEEVRFKNLLIDTLLGNIGQTRFRSFLLLKSIHDLDKEFIIDVEELTTQNKIRFILCISNFSCYLNYLEGFDLLLPLFKCNDDKVKLFLETKFLESITFYGVSLFDKLNRYLDEEKITLSFLNELEEESKMFQNLENKKHKIKEFSSYSLFPQLHKKFEEKNNERLNNDMRGYQKDNEKNSLAKIIQTVQIGRGSYWKSERNEQVSKPGKISSSISISMELLNMPLVDYYLSYFINEDWTNEQF
ncbi:hypothetical protein [Flammeovirga sp. EKP202]|uniref:hypothetical protein n=1 Tax=Flammeovirga sp. EKP202 TaxID=2770592 RepID=UPI00165EF501|nr:hypothetical protein [Flammeovirga sp. EKP202]MBD0404224.1 hypothetical protein [Flammeovirga sp. EKP202]